MKNIIAAVLTFTLVLCFGTSAYAQGISPLPEGEGGGNIAPQPCDTRYWNQLSSRAWLEAEREIMQNQNLIFKPDSVMEYVCLDDFLDFASGPGGNIFVHTLYFGRMIIARGADGSMDKGLTDVVFASMVPYVDNNFSHTYLGGRAQHMNGPANQNLRAAARVTASYNCTIMANVWQTAKCANFVDNANFQRTDGFYPFKQITGHDGGPNIEGYEEINEVRNFPNPCGGPNANNSPGPPNTGIQADGTWQRQNQIAENKSGGGSGAAANTASGGGGGGGELYPYKQPNAQIFQDVGARLAPGQCDQAIMTGVQVIVKGQEQGEDGVCTNPGCTYSDGSCTSGGGGGTGGTGGTGGGGTGGVTGTATGETNI